MNGSVPFTGMFGSGAAGTSTKQVKGASGEVAGIATSSTPAFAPATHVRLPKEVKAVYMSAWVGGTPSARQKLISLIDRTEINAIVLDIKDYTGNIAFEPRNQSLLDVGCFDHRMRDIDELLNMLHEKKIYVIGRVQVFQDPCFAKKHPEAAVTSKKTGKPWGDKKGINWMDASSPVAWNYITEIARESYDRGFDEINLDYVRFPTDGDMADASFPASGTSSKSAVLKKFFTHIDSELRDPAQATGTRATNERLMISADVFGLVTTAANDMGIGQMLEDILPHVDFLSPMVYPSHFAAGWEGIKNPATQPYKVIHDSMLTAVNRAKAMGENPLKLRPWLQDFNLGATYTAEMVRTQIQATYDVGLTSWLLWDPNNRYTEAALKVQ